MKKILAVILAAVFSAALCVAASAQFSLDRLNINANTLTTMPDDPIKTADEVKIAVGDKLYILGWAMNTETNSNLKEVVYTIDGAEKKCADNYRDRPGLCEFFGMADNSLNRHAGFGTDENALELTGIDQLGDGTYKMAVLAKYEDGTTEALKPEFTLVVGTGENKAEDPTPSNPETADTSVIAIAAVACIALAGVVVAKKVK